MKVTFWGAARQVTGSMHLVQLDGGTQVLIDCGLDYENRKEFDHKNANFPFKPADIDLLILTHAHIDHSGNVPNLIKQGFVGDIICSGPTLELSEYLLQDSLNIQMMDIRKKRKQFYRKKNKKHASSLPQPLFAKRHITDMVDMAIVLEPGEVFEYNSELSIEFFAAGHILGAMSAKLTIKESNGAIKKLGFTGDLGNFNSKLVPDPQVMDELDYLVSESTYGGRKHMTDSRKAEEILLEEITETCVNKRGKLVIPAFSVGRTQSILFTINQLFMDGKMPNIKVFTDSPLAIRSTRVYQNSVGYLNDEAKQFQAKHGSLFNFPLLHVVEDERESEFLSVLPEPCIIVSAAGMVEGGRIQMHIRNNIASEQNTVMIAGFCAEGTLGDRLLKGQGFVEIDKKQKEVHSKIIRTDVFSAHPDHSQLVDYFQRTAKAGSVKKLFLVHGEEAQMMKLAEDIDFIEVHTPMRGEVFEL